MLEAILEAGYHSFLYPLLFTRLMEKYGFCFVWVFLIVTTGINVFNSSTFHPEVPPILEFQRVVIGTSAFLGELNGKSGPIPESFFQSDYVRTRKPSHFFTFSYINKQLQLDLGTSWLNDLVQWYVNKSLNCSYEKCILSSKLNHQTEKYPLDHCPLLCGGCLHTQNKQYQICEPYFHGAGTKQPVYRQKNLKCDFTQETEFAV